MLKHNTSAAAGGSNVVNDKHVEAMHDMKMEWMKS